MTTPTNPIQPQIDDDTRDVLFALDYQLTERMAREAIPCLCCNAPWTGDDRRGYGRTHTDNCAYILLSDLTDRLISHSTVECD